MRRTARQLVCLAILLSAGIAAAQQEGDGVVTIGTQRQLFIDDYIVDQLEPTVRRVFHPVTKHPEPVVVPDKPWETPSFIGTIGNCVFWDEEEQIYKMFYTIYYLVGGKWEQQHYAYATSHDGLMWEKPNLGIWNYEGSKENNLIWDFDSPRYGKELFFYNNIIKDVRDPDPARRYKMFGMWAKFKEGLDPATNGYAGYGAMVAFSPDGFHWTEAPENPVLPNGDTHTLLGWDDRIGKYVAYPRTPIRAIGYSTSDDFIHWTETPTVLEADEKDPPNSQIYGMPVFKQEGVYFGLPWMFIAAGTEPLDTELTFSRDGVNWQRVFQGDKFIPLGPGGAMDDTYAIGTNPIVVGDELFFYYMACGFPHGPMYPQESKYPGVVALARLRLDGFVSLDCALDQGGTMLTKPLRFTGGRLLVNVNCPNGTLRAELQSADGTPLPGFAEGDCDAISVDSVRQQITWQGNGDISALAGTPVRLKLRIADGSLYAFGFAE